MNESRHNMDVLWNKQLENSKDKIAVVYGDNKWTYKEIDDMSNEIKNYILQHSSLPYIGVIMDNSDSYVITILGILKAGKAFVPIDKEYPKLRQKKIIEKCKIDCIIVDEKNTGVKGSVLFENAVKCDVNEFACQSSFAGNYAYILHTSGTTGEPKGVLIRTESLVNLIQWFGKTFMKENIKNVLQLAKNSFDVSIEEIFGCLFHGRTLYIPSQAVRMHKKRLREYILKHEIQLVQVVPVLLQELFGEVEKLPCIQTIISGGEALSEPLKELILKKGYELYNNYGLTETTVDALSAKCHINIPVNLGNEVDNCEIYLLREDGSIIQNSDEVGELAIGGINLAECYIGDIEQNNEKFTQVMGKRIYKTGDLVRRDSNNFLFFVGRNDNQVKVNGKRIELGEIEQVFSSIFTVSLSSCIIGDNGKILLFYQSENPISAQIASAELKKVLPEYMIPVDFILVDEFPLTPNGKVDSDALVLVRNQRSLEEVGEIDECQLDSFTREIIRIISNALVREESEINIEKNLNEEGLDSFSYINVVIDIEDRYDVELEDEFMIPSEFTSTKEFIEKLRSFLEKKGKI